MLSYILVDIQKPSSGIKKMQITDLLLNVNKTTKECWITSSDAILLGLKNQVFFGSKFFVSNK